MKQVTIFLASSTTELNEERLKIKAMITDVNGKFFHRDISFVLFGFEQGSVELQGERSQNAFNRQIADSDYSIFIVAKSFNKGTAEEFDIALKSFSEKQKPKISIYFKDIPDTEREPETRNFMKFLSEEKEYYYSIYSSADQLCMRILTEINENPNLLSVKNGNVVMDDQILFTVKDDEEIYNDETLKSIKFKIEKLEAQLRSDATDKDAILKERSKLEGELERIGNQVGNILLNIYSSIGFGYSECYKKAVDLFEKGKSVEAKNELFYHIEERRAEQNEKIQASRLALFNQFKSIKPENSLLIDLIRLEKDDDERIDELYKENIEAEKLCGLAPESEYEYADYLFENKRYEDAFPHIFRYCAYHYYMSVPDFGHSFDFSKGLLRLGTLYSHLRQFDDAFCCYKLCADIHCNLEATEGNRYIFEAADAYNKLGNVSDDKKEYELGEMYHGKAIGIYKSLLDDKDPGLKQKAARELAYSYNKQGNIFRHRAIDTGDKEYFDMALAMYNSDKEIIEKYCPQDEKTMDSAAINEKSIGLTYFAMGDYKTAVEHFKASEELYKKLDGHVARIRFPYAKTLFHEADSMNRLLESGDKTFDEIEIAYLLIKNQEILKDEYSRGNNKEEVVFELIRSYELIDKIRQNEKNLEKINCLKKELDEINKNKFQSFLLNK